MRRTILAACVLLTAGSALAVDLFTVYVPLQLSQIHPSISHVRLRCELRGRHPITGMQTTLAIKGHPTPIEFPLTAGAYSGTATVVYTSEDLGTVDPSYVNESQCQFLFRAPDWSLYQPSDLSTGPVLGHQPGTPFRWQILTPIP